LILEIEYLMVNRYFIFLCLLFLIVVLTAISYSIQINTIKPKTTPTIKEGLFSLTQCSEAKKNSSPTTSKSSLIIKNTAGKLPLSQYHIFSSWNTACSGKFVSTQQIQNVLSSGCRFLDFPITNIKGEPKICSTFFTNNISMNSITLSQAIQICVNNAFQNYITIDYNCTSSSNNTKSQTYTIKNFKDPLFIQLRFTNKKTTIDFLNTVTEIVGYLIKGRQYNTNSVLDTDTTLDQLRNKIVLLVDITNLSTVYKDSLLPNITNLVVGHFSGVMMYPFQTLLKSVPKNIPKNINASKINNKNLDSFLPIDQYTMAIPRNILTKTVQPTISQVIELAVYHNVQFMPFLFYKKNSLLTNYIHFFQQKKSAFLPIQSLNNILLQEHEKAVMK